MTESTQEWPRTCEVCGTGLEQVQVQFTESDFSEGVEGTPVVRDVCPNPDCPRHQQEYAAPDATDDRPGSLGGDNGGG
jgi:hypothetical protein